jgi:hypothetical protein
MNHGHMTDCCHGAPGAGDRCKSETIQLGLKLTPKTEVGRTSLGEEILQSLK